MIRVWCVAVCLAALVPAQTTDIILSGQVLDPSGAIVPAASVTAQNTGTGVVQRVAVNQSGVYQFPPLAPGVYRLMAEASGFKKLVLNDVVLEIGARLNINLTMEVGALAESVEVTAEAETTLGLASTSVGGVVSGLKAMQLPLPSRDVLDLVLLQAGVVGDNFSGNRIGQLNITMDGINVQDNRINAGVFSAFFSSADLVSEFRIVTSPADAEYGRGTGQIQMVTRAGSNRFGGSLWESHRNTVLNANTWFNNQRGSDANGNQISPRNILIRNQFGGRIGGPIRRNRTFFHFLYDAQRQRTRAAVNTTVLTDQARRGIFRFYPGVQNGNAESSTPVVDLNGNPVRPAGATGGLESVSLFGRDPNRMAADPTGNVAKMMALMPLPNNYRLGDGLNTAGFTWSRVASADRDQINVRIDHVISDKHRANFSYSKEDTFNRNGFLAQPFPTSPGGNTDGKDRLYSFGLVSTLRANLLNDVRIGVLRPRPRFNSPWEVLGTDILPRRGSEPYAINFVSFTDPILEDNDPQGRISPVYQYANTTTWIKDRHSFKGGAEVRFVSTNGFNSFDVLPRADIGTGRTPIQNITNIANIGRNGTLAQNLLNDLSGSLNVATQAFNSPGGANPVFLPGEYKQRTWRQREVSLFFKDDFKLRPSLTLNLGVRWEYYGVPWDANGRTAGLVGGPGGIFGITGTTFAELYQAGRVQNGQMTRVTQIGKNSPNPDQLLYPNDWNNFAPAVGLSWSLPWLGKDKTVLRIGYGWGYERNSLRNIDVIGGDLPGLREVNNFRPPGHLSLANVPFPLQPLGKPLDLVPFTERGQTLRGYDGGLRTPYIQNWNLSIQREVMRNTTLDVRYVGSKGTRLLRTTNVNELNVFETGLLEAFLVTQAGGHHPLLDRFFMGLTVPGLGMVDGRTRTGSDAARTISTTQNHLALNNVGGFADYFNRDAFAGAPGAFLRRAGLPENYFVGNPQFNNANLVGNFANSTYHSMQLEVIRRPVHGLTFQANYTWSKALGEEEGAGQELLDSYRDGRNRRLEKRLLSFSIEHVVRTNALWELPFGPGRKFLGATHGAVARLVEGWQLGSIFNVFSGTPISLTSNRNTINQFGDDNTPLVHGDFSKATGAVQKLGNGVAYFGNLRQVADPYIQNITAANGIRNLSNLFAIADQSGRVILSNPVPGTLGNLSQRFLFGPGSFRFDMNIVKRIRISESMSAELRVDAIDVTNTPQFNNPNTDINSVNFGRITGAGGNRIVIVNARFNF